MRKRQKRKRYIKKVRQISSVKQASSKKTAILSRLSEKERDLYERLRASLLPNDYGIAASVVQHPETKLWQGWISDGSALIFISARKDIEQAYTDIEELLALSERDDFGLEDALNLWGNAKVDDDFLPESLPEHVSKGLLYLIRLIYEIDERVIYSKN